MFTQFRIARAAKQNDVERLRALVEKHPESIDARSGVNRYTALHLALKNGSEDAARALVDHGADVNLGDLVSSTPLHFAAWKCSVAIVDFLIERGAQTDIQQTSQKNSPLHFAAMSGKADIVASLLAHGANPNLRNQDGMTALHLAVHKGDVPVLQCLLAGRAEVNTENTPVAGYRFTPLFTAVYFERADIVELLLSAGADPNQARTNGNMEAPLGEAVRKRNTQIAQLLLSHGPPGAAHAKWIEKNL